MREEATRSLCTAAFRRGISVLTSAAILAASTASLAGEPVNNNFPAANSANDLAEDMQVLVTSGPSGADTTTNPTISTSTDVDYILVVCTANRNVSRVTLGNLSADIDLYVYGTTSAHPLLGQSILSSSQPETVNLSPTTNAVVVKVVGFNGATSPYIVGFGCT